MISSRDEKEGRERSPEIRPTSPPLPGQISYPALRLSVKDMVTISAEKSYIMNPADRPKVRPAFTLILAPISAMRPK